MIDEDRLYPYQREMLRWIMEHWRSDRPIVFTPSGYAITQAHMQALGTVPDTPTLPPAPEITVTSAKALGGKPGIVIIDDIAERLDTPEERERMKRWFDTLIVDEGHFVRNGGVVFTSLDDRRADD